MECPECHGEGRILLFTSSRECAACGGTGSVSPKPEPAQAADPPTLQNAYETGNPINTGADGGSVHITAGDNTGSGGDITITSGYATGTSGVGGAITITGGSGSSSWYEERENAAMTFSSPSSPSCSFFTGNTRPNEKGVHASLGSLFLCDAGGEGTVWVKTGEGIKDWCQLSTGGGGHAHEQLEIDQTEVDTILDSIANMGMSRDELFDYCKKWSDEEHRIRNLEYARDITPEQANLARSEMPVVSIIPAIAPVGQYLLADMMAMIEQTGEKVVAFVSSSRDFADVRKMEGSHVVWEGREVTVYGVPFWHSPNLEPGAMYAVSSDKRLVLCSITR
jgi:hypothetical protein